MVVCRFVLNCQKEVIERPAMQMKEYDSGEILFKEGDVCESMFKVVEGSVSVQVAASNGDSIGLATLEEDKIFEEMAVFESWPRSATIVIREDHTKLLEIMRDEIRDCLREDPQQVKNIITNLSHRQKRLTEYFLHACNTIREMDETKTEPEERSDTLLDKITRFVTTYTRAMHYLTPYHVKNDQALDHDSEADRDHSMTFVEDTVIFTQGEESGSMYYIQNGSVGIFTDYGTEDEKCLTSLGGRTFFGDMGLIEKLPRKATAVVLEDDTVLQEITEENLLELYERTPELIISCMQHMASKMRNLTRDYLAACEMIATIVTAEKEERKLTFSEKERKIALLTEAEGLRF